MFDVKDDAKAGYRRVEVLTGPGRRRRWSAAEKARIVAETLAPGVRVSAVARRWQLCPQQLSAWRRDARAGLPSVRNYPPPCSGAASLMQCGHAAGRTGAAEQ